MGKRRIKRKQSKPNVLTAAEQGAAPDRLQRTILSGERHSPARFRRRVSLAFCRRAQHHRKLYVFKPNIIISSKQVLEKTMISRRVFIKSTLLLCLPITCVHAEERRGGRAADKTIFAASKSVQCFTRSDIPQSLSENYDDIVRRIHIEVWKSENAFRRGDTVESIAKRLNLIAEAAARFSGTDTQVAKELFQAEILVAWIRTNVDYWVEMNSFPGRERVAWNSPEKVLSHSPRPRCNCDGYCRLTMAIGTSMGLKITGVGGALRALNGKIEAGPGTDYLQGVPWNHGWNLFEINGKYLPADTSNAWKFRDLEFRQGWRGKTDSANALPMDEKEWDIFLGSHRMLQSGGKPVEEDPLTTMPLASWLETSPAYLEAIITELRLRDTQRNKELEAK